MQGRQKSLDVAPALAGEDFSILEDFARASSGWFWEMDAQLRFSYMSSVVEDITGVAPEWHYGKSRQDIGIPASVRPEVWRRHLETLERREPFQGFVFQRTGPDGAKWMETSGVPIFDRSGAFTGYRGVATEVTARVEAERRANLLTQAIENLNDLFVLWDEDDRIVTSNARFRAINAQVAEATRPGTRFEDHIRAALAAGLYPQAAGREEAWLAERLECHRACGDPVPLQRQNGRWILLSEHRLPDGCTVTISSDISEQKRSEQALAAQHDLLQTAFSTMPDGVQVLDDDMRLIAWNDQLFEVMDLDRDAILQADDPGEAFRYTLARRGEYGEGDVDALVTSRKIIGRTKAPVQYEHQLVTGKWMECRGNPIDGGGYLAIYRDIDESKRLREELERQASTDPLTGVLNRRRFMDRAVEEFQRARRYGCVFSLLLLDVDHFKSVNDRHGHAAGDEVLRCIAAVCTEVIRDMDFLGRIGGEEFAFVCPETGSKGAVTAAERIRSAVAATCIDVPSGELKVTVSIGLAEIQPAHVTVDNLLADADAALYEAKDAGRDRVAVCGSAADRR